jgi:predicted metalloprotease
MKLGGQRSSGNVQDRRGIGIGGGVGIGTVLIAIVAMFLGVDPTAILNMAEQAAPQQQQRPADPNAPPDEMQVFVSKVLGSTEDVWREVFRSGGRSYRDAKLVLFTQVVGSACGTGQSAMGPFYCPGDQSVYIDLAFFRDLHERFRAPGDFAQAYVIAHEVGHHVQNQLGIMEKMHAMQGRVSKGEYNQASVRLELQADCFAGVWAHHAANAGLLEPGDVEEGLNAASAIGDDRLQKQTQGTIVPESFTHGSSAQRVRWFRKGMEGGRMTECDTFATRVL